MRISLKELRSTAAMAQFSPREVPAHILKLIEESADLAGEAMVSVDPDSARVIEPAPMIS